MVSLLKLKLSQLMDLLNQQVEIVKELEETTLIQNAGPTTSGGGNSTTTTSSNNSTTPQSFKTPAELSAYNAQLFEEIMDITAQESGIVESFADKLLIAMKHKV